MDFSHFVGTFCSASFDAPGGIFFGALRISVVRFLQLLISGNKVKSVQFGVKCAHKVSTNSLSTDCIAETNGFAEIQRFYEPNGGSNFIFRRSAADAGFEGAEGHRLSNLGQAI